MLKYFLKCLPVILLLLGSSGLMMARQDLDIPPQDSYQDSINYLFKKFEDLRNTRGATIKEVAQTIKRFSLEHGDQQNAFEIDLRMAKYLRSIGKREEASAILDSLASISELGIYLDIYTEVLRDLADFSMRDAQFEKADSLYQVVLNAYQKTNDSTGMARVYRGLSSVSRRQGKLDLALERILRALDIFKDRIDINGLAISYNSLGIIYKERGEFEKGLEAYESALEYHQENNSRSGMASGYVNIGTMLGSLGKEQESIEFFEKGLDLFEELGNTRAVAALSFNLGISHKKLGDYKTYLELTQKSYDTYQQMGIKPLYLIVTSLGEAYALNGEEENAKKYLEEGKLLTEDADNIDYKKQAYSVAAESYAMLGDYKRAFEDHKLFKAVHDSILDLEATAKFLELETTHQVKEKDAEITYLSQREEQQKLRNLLLLGILGLSIVVIALLWRLSSNRKRLNLQLSTQKEIIEDKNEKNELLLREIHHRVKNNMQFISSLLSLQSDNLDGDEAYDVLRDSQERVYSMSLIHQNLYQEENLTGIDVEEYLKKLIVNLFNSNNISPDRIKLNLQIEPLNLDVDTMVPLGLIINELISNALKYAFPGDRDGTITVSIKEDQDMIRLLVADNGVGMSDLKNINLENSFGYKLINAFKSQLNANLHISNQEGTSVELTFKEYQKAG